MAHWKPSFSVDGGAWLMLGLDIVAYMRSKGDAEIAIERINAALSRAVAAERERCAVECEFLADKAFLMPADPYYECAARIRGNVGRGALRLPPEPVA